MTRTRTSLTARTWGPVLVLASLAAALGLPSATQAAAHEAGPTNGALAINSEDPETIRTQRIRLMAPDGGPQTTVTSASRQEWEPGWSPDGNSLAYYRGFGSWEIVRVEADGSGERAIGFGGHSAKHPEWSADGKLVYYIAADNVGNDQLWRMRADGTGTERAPLPAHVVFGGRYAFAPDGQLVYTGLLRDPETGFAGRPGIYALDLTAGPAATPRALTELSEAFYTSRVDVGPDGRVLFDMHGTTNVSGCFEAQERTVDLYTVPLAGGPVSQITSTSAFGGPDEVGGAWSPDGTRIVALLQSYGCNDRQVVVRGDQSLHLLTAQGAVVRDYGFRASGYDWQPCGPTTRRCGAPAQPTVAPPATPESTPPTPGPTTTAPTTTPTTTPATTAAPGGGSSPSADPSSPGPTATTPDEEPTTPDEEPTTTAPQEEPVGVTLSPTVVAAGQTMTATYTGSPGQIVDVLSRTQPATGFSTIRRIVLDATGFATTTHRPQRNTRLTTRTASGLPGPDQPLVQVRSVGSLTAQRTGTRAYSFAGRIYPARAQRLVNLYRDDRLAGQARTDAQGVYRLTRTLPGGTAVYQVRTPDDTYNLGTSRSVRLTVR